MMKATGIVRRIDDLGRIVIPKEIRRTMHIREGDPLEIYTAKDGEVIFKKYSPMGEFTDFAANVCETLNRTTGHISAVVDRDSIIAVSGVPGRELNEKRISSELERLMEDRQIYQYRRGGRAVPVAAGEDKYKLALAAPIIAEGDVLGGVIFLSDEDVPESGEVEYKLAQTVAGFLGNQLSN
jgi:AbrB family transcriptional regulator (stage V sporulation protein T)